MFEYIKNHLKFGTHRISPCRRERLIDLLLEQYKANYVEKITGPRTQDHTMELHAIGNANGLNIKNEEARGR